MKAQELVDAMGLEYDLKTGWNTDEAFDRLVLVLEACMKQRDVMIEFVLQMSGVRSSDRNEDFNAELLAIAKGQPRE